ncbi:hypothetical protein [Bartonella alsatica]|nr:hypothetical protein [Bartonella alsatica]
MLDDPMGTTPGFFTSFMALSGSPTQVFSLLEVYLERGKHKHLAVSHPQYEMILIRVYKSIIMQLI